MELAKWNFVTSLSAAKPKCSHSSWAALSQVFCVQVTTFCSETAEITKGEERLTESVFVNLRPSVTFDRALTQKAEL